MVAAVASGLALDAAGHFGVVSVSGTSLLTCLSVGLLASGRPRGRAATSMIAGAGALGPILVLRSSPWVIVPVIVAGLALLMIGASVGSQAAGVPRTPSEGLLRAALAACHVMMGPGLLRRRADASRPWAAFGRGALLAAAISAPLVGLLAWADPVFQSWLDVSGEASHAALLVLGAWLLLGLVRAASSTGGVPVLPRPISIGRIEATCALSAVAASYGAFVVAQLVAVSGGGRRVLTTRGLTYAEYARSGFFQMLACAALTLLVLLAFRWSCRECADHPVLRALAALVGTLTIAIVFTAVERLRLYQAAFGLTMLRLAVLVVCGWMAAMFAVVVAVCLSRAVRPLAPAAVAAVCVATVAGWALANPAALVARTNLDRAASGQSLDVVAAVDLGPDAVPTIVARAGRLDPAIQEPLLRAACRSGGGDTAGLSYNHARSAAEDACLPSDNPSLAR